jgi:hypothetical protein
MRDAEHRREPIPHPLPEKEFLEEAEEDEDDDSESEESEGGKEGDGGNTRERMGEMTKKVKKGTRTKVRKTWDKLGMLKEEVSHWGHLCCQMELIVRALRL